MASDAKKLGRPNKTDGKRDKTIAVRITQQDYARLTEFRRREPDLPTDSEALRRMMEKELKRQGL